MRRKDPVRDTPVSAWLQKHNPAVQIINNAVGGTTSRTTAECFDGMVGKDASSFCSTATTTGGQLHPAGGQGYSSGDVSAVLWLQSVCQNMKHVYMHAHADSPASSSCQAYVHVHVAAFSVAPTDFIR